MNHDEEIRAVREASKDDRPANKYTIDDYEIGGDISTQAAGAPEPLYGKVISLSTFVENGLVVQWEGSARVELVDVYWCKPGRQPSWWKLDEHGKWWNMDILKELEPKA